jgi:hypothetical protein
VEDAAPESPADGRLVGPLPLLRACVAWCDPGLVRAYQEAAALPRPQPVFRRRSWGAGSRDGFGTDDRDTLRADARAEQVAGKRREVEALQRQRLVDLVADLRTRIAQGEILLVGLQTEPVPATARSVVPAAWASRMRIELGQDRVRLGPAVFVDVLAERRPAAGGRATQPAAAEQPEITDEGSTARADRPRRKPGRHSFDDAIREALRRRWPQVQAEASKAPQRKPNMSQLARHIEKDIRKAAGKLGTVTIPHQHTIRRNLPRIYDALLRELA